MTPTDAITWYDVLARGGFPLAMFVLLIGIYKGWVPTPRERDLLERQNVKLEGDNLWLRNSLFRSLGLVTRFGEAALTSPPSSSTQPTQNGG